MKQELSRAEADAVAAFLAARGATRCPTVHLAPNQHGMAVPAQAKAVAAGRSPEERQAERAWTLYVMAGLSFEDVAERMGIHFSTACQLANRHAARHPHAQRMLDERKAEATREATAQRWAKRHAAARRAADEALHEVVEAVRRLVGEGAGTGDIERATGLGRDAVVELRTRILAERRRP